MNKTAIKKFAIEARNKLRASVTVKAGMLGITEKECSSPIMKGTDFEIYKTAAGTEVTLNRSQCEQRRKLVDQINARGFDNVIEEVAYTWFNRICAIRFMEVNDYLPSRVRVLSSEKEGKTEPDIVTQAPDVDLDFTDKEREFILEAKMSNKSDELFRMLFIKQCNKLSEILLELFEATEDYTEMLLNISYTNEDDIVRMLIGENGIPEEDFNIQVSGQVEIIGWLYQYYNEERKNEVINIYKGTVKKEDIPAATQLFTTDWVVRYMVDNSLGRYWIERNPESKLSEKLEFFVMPKSGVINYVDEKIEPTELTFIDPCMGSGHILVYAFDVLMEIYRECGYSDRDAALNIVQNNLFGLDIDKRAYQLAYFAVMMKARSYNRRALTQGIHHNLCEIQESNGVSQFTCEGITFNKQQDEIGQYLLDSFKDAKELGSLITVEAKDYKSFAEYLLNLNPQGQIDLFQNDWNTTVQPLCLHLAKQASVLSRKYCVVATNPPYLGKMQGQLKDFVIKNYKKYSGDLYATFMYRNSFLCKYNGYSAFMTPFTWMFIRQYGNLRDFIIENKNIVSLVQLEYSAFEEATVPICSFVLANQREKRDGIYFKLSEFKGGMTVQREKVLDAINNIVSCQYVYEKNVSHYNNIDGHPIAFWASEKIEQIFMKYGKFEDAATIRVGMHTGNNDLFLREWYEVDYNNICFDCKSHEESIRRNEKWYPYNKGGGTRKWYGYRTKVVNWKHGGEEIHKFHNLPMNYHGAPVRAKELQFMESITWSDIGSTGNFGCRYTEEGAMFDVKGSSAFMHDINKIQYAMGFLNSNIVSYLLQMLNPTISYQVGNISSLPFAYDARVDIEKVKPIVNKCIKFEKDDWNSEEISWNYKKNPLLQLEDSGRLICDRIDLLRNIRQDIFHKQREYEIELNKIFMDIYGISEEELSSDVDETHINIRLSDDRKDICDLISYAVGCMFGRYSLDVDGLAYAGGDWDSTKYTTFIPDADNIIPITDEEYFSDDIVGRFVEFVKTVYGADTLEENLDFIAKALGNKGDTSREVIRNYFLKDFYADHLKVYQKRPIYWLFDSGKQNGFKTLIYMHRYDADTVGRVRTDYLHRAQKYVETAMQSAQYTIDNASSASEKSKATKAVPKYTKQLAEMKIYDEAIAHIANKRMEIDLDDGVKVNYEKFQGVEVAQEGKKALKVDLLAKLK